MFNANFYLVSATVIPVFFLAVTLQGRIFSSAENLMRRLLRSAQERLERFEQAVGAPDRQPLNVRREIVAQSWRLLLFQLIWMISIVVLAFSVTGETLAVLALDQGRASALVHTLVLAAVFGLTIGTGILLYVRLQMLWGRNMRLVFLRYPRLFWRILRSSARAARKRGDPKMPVAQPCEAPENASGDPG